MLTNCEPQLRVYWVDLIHLIKDNVFKIITY